MSEWQTPYKIGDPDPTVEDEKERSCGAVGKYLTEERIELALCTWGVTRPHGTHVAGDGRVIVHVWPDEFTRDRWRP